MSWVYLERAIVAASGTLVAALVGALVWLDLASGNVGPKVEARILSAGPPVTFEVRNSGDAPVTDVQVKVTQGDEEVTHTFPHLPAGAARKGTAVFEKPGEAAAQVLGYLEP